MPPMPRALFWFLVGLCATVAVVRIIATYPVFSQFYDEPDHISCGMEWLQKHVYLYDRQHPPTSRVAVALPLYFQGLRLPPVPEPRPSSVAADYAVDDGNAILYSHGQYMSNLAWARAAILPFFLLNVWLLALLGDFLFGPWTALGAVFLFTMLPPVLGHGSVATTDTAPIAALLAVIYALIRWIEKPGKKRSAVLGLTLGLALIAKFSLIPFIGVGAFLTVIWIWIRRPEILPWRGTAPRQLLADVGIVSIIAFLVLWSVYRFHVDPILTASASHAFAGQFGPVAGPIVERALTIKLPLREFVGGMRVLMSHNSSGHDSFLLGSYRVTGWWYYFPVILAVKTPLAFLGLVLLGMPPVVRRLWSGEGDWRQNVPFLFAIGILISCVTARIDIGVRHILPIFPLLSLVAAEAVVSSMRTFLNSPAAPTTGRWLRRALPAIAAALVLMLMVESASAHPDYVAWFNLLGGNHPERISVDSNLDWGQDLKRLSDRLRQLNVDNLKIAYWGTADLSQMGLPPFVELNPREPVSGWIAVSVYKYELECAQSGNYCWLHDQQPVERVGRSIFLYHLTDPVVPAKAANP